MAPLMFALILGPIGALMAFLITLNEYTHHYADMRKPLRLAIESAIVAFIALGGLSWLVCYLMVGRK